MAANTLPAAISILSFLLPATYPLSRLAGEGGSIWTARI